MRLAATAPVLAAAFAMAAPPAEGGSISQRADLAPVIPLSDATVSYSGIICDQGVPCASIPLGTGFDLVAFKGNRDYERILLGFDISAVRTPIARCMLSVPAPIEPPGGGNYSLSVSVTDNDWDEATVSGAIKRIDGKLLGDMAVPEGQPPGQVDVTAACQTGDSKISLFVDTHGPMIRFNSRESGSDGVFALEIE